MSDIGAGFEIALKLMGAFAVAAAAVVGTGIYVGVSHHNEAKAVAAMTARAQDTMTGKSLTLISMDKFRKPAPGCDAERPYGANFTAQDKDGKVVRGHVCSAPNHESIVYQAP